MFATPAYAQAPQGAPAGGGPMDLLLQFAPIILIFIVGYFIIVRPQQQRAKKHAEDIAAVFRAPEPALT